MDDNTKTVTVPAAQPDNKQYKIEISHWTMRDYRQWAALGTQERGWEQRANEIMTAVIRAWPWQGNPTKIEAYDDLKPYQWKDCLKAVEAATADLFRGPQD